MTDHVKILTPEVAIVGAGPAGLSAGKKLAPAIDGDVILFDRERQAGGIPRHADHPGYGIRDRKRFMKGPTYAKALVSEAKSAGAKIMTQVTVTGWADEHTLEATTPSGRIHIRPKVFLFATGARERPRAARMIPGSRPAGVLTTGQLQNLVHLNHEKVGTRAVVVGAELVSWSAVMTLSEVGCSTEALISEYPKSESYWLFRVPGRVFFRTRVETGCRVIAVHGKGRVTGVEIEDIRTRARKTIACDTVVFTGDWIPDNELLRMAGVELDPVSLSPVVDQDMRTTHDNIFAVGNLNHPVETADVVALEGEYAADRVLGHLRGGTTSTKHVRLRADKPIRWVSPSSFSPDGPAPARELLVTWVDEFINFPVVTITQGGRTIARSRLIWPAAPGRAFRIPSRLLKDVSPDGGDVTISLS